MCYRGYNAPWVMSTNGVDGVGEALALPPCDPLTVKPTSISGIPCCRRSHAFGRLQISARSQRPALNPRSEAGALRDRKPAGAAIDSVVACPRRFRTAAGSRAPQTRESHGIVVEQLAEALGADWRDTAEMTNTCERCVTAVTALGAEWNLAGRRGCRRCPAPPPPGSAPRPPPDRGKRHFKPPALASALRELTCVRAVTGLRTLAARLPSPA
jgi:hypothetical protein